MERIIIYKECVWSGNCITYVKKCVDTPSLQHLPIIERLKICLDKDKYENRFTSHRCDEKYLLHTEPEYSIYHTEYGIYVRVKQ